MEKRISALIQRICGFPDLVADKTRESGKEFPDSGLLFTECVSAEEVLAQIDDRIVQRLARIAWFESEFARCFGTVQIPKVLGHFNAARLDRRSEVPLFEK